jgi:hypothetical protein
LAATLLGPGSLKEKVRAIAEGFALSKGVEIVAIRVLGPRLAAQIFGRAVGFVVGTAISMCDSMECERQEREERVKQEREAIAKVEEALEQQIIQRAQKIFFDQLLKANNWPEWNLFFDELQKGNQPEWNTALNMALFEKAIELELALDEAIRAMQEQVRNMRLDPTPPPVTPTAPWKEPKPRPPSISPR